MNYELIPLTSRRAPKLSPPAIAKAYRKPPKEDERMSIDPIECLEDLLDELGVDYAWDGDSIYWNSLDGIPWTVERRHDGNLALYSPKCTPRQAVDATLGSYKNELLRDKIADYDKMYTHLCEQLASVKRSLAAAHAESAKLRELCKLAFTCIVQGEDEYGSDWSCAGCEFCDKCDGLIQARVTAQELGVEVDA